MLGEAAEDLLTLISTQLIQKYGWVINFNKSAFQPTPGVLGSNPGYLPNQNIFFKNFLLGAHA